MKKVVMAVLCLLVATMGVSAFMGHAENKEEIKQALDDNDFSAWKTAMESNLNEENFQRMREHHQQREGMKENREAMKAALETGDYEAWLTAVEAMQKPRISEIITEENFPTLIQMHEAMQEGDFELAEELREELGLPQKPHKEKMGKGLRR